MILPLEYFDPLQLEYLSNSSNEFLMLAIKSAT